MSTSFFGCLPCYAITTLSCYLYVFSLWRDKYDDNVHYRSSRISSGRACIQHTYRRAAAVNGELIGQDVPS